MLTQQQLEDAAKCESFPPDCDGCSLGKLSPCIYEVGKTALALQQESEKKDEALRVAKEALVAIMNGPYSIHYSYFVKLRDAVSVIDKALGKNS